jgi:hypothetical protein
MDHFADGHRGAALISAHLMCADNHFDDIAVHRIVELFDGHMLTFGQSLVELAAMGDGEWAESCRTAFRKYVTVTRMGPQPGDRRINDHQFSQLRPDDTEYWQKRGDRTLGLGHVFKYPYAYYDLLARAKDPMLQRQFDAKAWQLF